MKTFKCGNMCTIKWHEGRKAAKPTEGNSPGCRGPLRSFFLCCSTVLCSMVHFTEIDCRVCFWAFDEGRVSTDFAAAETFPCE